MFKTFKRTQRGVTLFELMLVLFVAAFIAAAVGTLYARVSVSYKANQTLDDVQQFVASIRSLYAQQGNYAGLTQGTLATSGLVPPGICPGTCTASSTMIYPFGTLKVALDSNDTTNTTFLITLASVPIKVCNDLGARFLPGVTALTIAGTAVTDVTSILKACVASGDFVLTYD
jgi:prepilin-type N-terminal cleavage/methylation domain-containing protein